MNLARVPHHIDHSLGLLQRDVPDERLVMPVGRLHFNEQDFGQNRAEVPHAEQHRPADVAVSTETVSSRISFPSQSRHAIDNVR